ncbi:MAG: phage tail tube protein [Pseudomonadales bacterium]|nr:phage tail tube protein [Pseudomonadales bacterium]
MTSSGANHSTTYVFESTRGTTPATPTLKPLRLTGNTLKLNRAQLQSNEQRADRQVASFRLGNNDVNGDLQFELTYATFDDWIEAVLGGTWAVKATETEITFSAANSDSSFNDSANGFVTAGFEAGDIITVSGFTEGANNDTFKIATVAAGKITVTDTSGSAVSLTDEAAGDSVTIATTADVVKAGLTRRYATVERKFNDATVKYKRYTGVEPNTMNLQIAPNAMVTGSIGCLGAGSTTDTSVIAGSTYPAANTNEPIDAFTGTIEEGGSEIAIVTDINVAMTNNRQNQFVVGSRNSIDPDQGKFIVTGTMTVHFDDLTLYNKYINETSSDLVLKLIDLDLNEIRIKLPNITYTNAPVDATDNNAITVPLGFFAKYDATTGTNITIERHPFS